MRLKRKNIYAIGGKAVDVERMYDDIVKENLIRNEARAESDEDLARAEREASDELFGREVEIPRG